MISCIVVIGRKNSARTNIKIIESILDLLVDRSRDRDCAVAGFGLRRRYLAVRGQRFADGIFTCVEVYIVRGEGESLSYPHACVEEQGE